MGRHFLPIIPRIILGVIDPAIIAISALLALVDPIRFLDDHLPNKPLPASYELDLHTRVLILTTSNFQFGAAPALLILVWVNKSVSVFRWTVAANIILESLYLYAIYYGVGTDYFWDPSQWNALMWARIVLPVGFNVVRLLTLLGAFGPLGEEKAKHA
ncbi:hypothetical protein GQ53DRAFT_804898 [Thozetella sp. PMI_491]|nr:hypothetical protein GQ53DRAFT_804898 [Thozetella sp. PMI_491]